MRELTSIEVQRVSGGLVGTKIPFFNGFIGGENMRGKPAGSLGAAVLAFEAGWEIGQKINQFNQDQFGMSLGVAIHRTFGGGSNITPSGTTRIDEEV